MGHFCGSEYPQIGPPHDQEPCQGLFSLSQDGGSFKYRQKKSSLVSWPERQKDRKGSDTGSFSLV